MSDVDESEHTSSLIADAFLVVMMLVSRGLQIRRMLLLVADGTWHSRPTILDLGGKVTLEAAVNVLSLLGSLLSERLRHSQGIYSLAQCVADCVMLSALVPGQRMLWVAMYVVLFVGASTSYALSSFHSFGWTCAWIMAVASLVDLAWNLKQVPTLPMSLPSSFTWWLAVEKGCGMLACVTYLGMLIYDDSRAPHAAATLLAAIPMFWPWFVNVFGQLVQDAVLLLQILTLPEMTRLKSPV
jgi:hypothetical protein